MSAIAALLARDGRVIGSPEIGSIVGAMTLRGPDRAGVWTRGAIGLGAATLLTLPEDVLGQPVIDRVTKSAIVFDGRLDARDELADAVGIPRTERTMLNDAGLLLRAYREVGPVIFERLLGDFAFALWDQPNTRLVCGRDVLGIRPLYYAVDNDECVVASELQAVLRDRAGVPNAGMIAEALSGIVTSRHETLFAGAFRVPPGCLLVVTGTTMRVSRFASIETPQPLHYRDEDQYFDHCREVLTRAVRDRLRSPAPVAVMLSGGIDSASVYAAARAEKNVGAYTVGYDDPVYDETAMAQRVVDGHDGSLRRVGVAAANYDYLGDVTRFRDLPSYPCGANSATMREAAVNDGVRVMLNGVGGDECFFGDTGRWTDWLLAGQWALLYAELKTWRYDADPTPWRDLARTTVQPLIPGFLRRGPGAKARSRARLPWLTASFQEETNLCERLRNVEAPQGVSYATAGMIRTLTCGSSVASMEEQDRLAAHFQHDERMPYLDRRVIDFALAIPETLRSRPGCPKYVTRRAWAGRVPDELLTPIPAADYTLQIVEALERVGGATRLSTLALADAGWVDGRVVNEMSSRLFSTARHSRAHIGYAWPLWCVFAVDEWYRRALAPSPRRAPASIASATPFG